MNVQNTMALSRWVQDNRGWLSSSERGSLAQAAVKAQEEMGFKVNSANLSRMMKEHDVPVQRMSQEKSERLAILAENEKLRDENETLRDLIAITLACAHLPDDLRVRLERGLPGKMLSAIQQG